MLRELQAGIELALCEGHLRVTDALRTVRLRLSAPALQCTMYQEVRQVLQRGLLVCVALSPLAFKPSLIAQPASQLRLPPYL
jgi:hypothetical protein